MIAVSVTLRAPPTVHVIVVFPINGVLGIVVGVVDVPPEGGLREQGGGQRDCQKR
jgi:hypothetical protein